MTMWQLLSDDGAGAAEGLALDEALMARVARDAATPRPTLRLYTYADHAALVGRYQTLDAEVDLDACAATGTAVSRRATGGGAIVMGRGQLGVALVLPAGAASFRQLIPELGGGVVEGLGRLGVRAEFGGKNDLLAGGRKIAGLGMYLDTSGALLFHTSLLVDLDIDFMLRVLRIPAAKLADKGAAAVAERVTTVSRELGRPIGMDVLRDVIAEGFAARFGITLSDDEPAESERTAATGLVVSRYANTSWLDEQHAQPDGTGSATFKSPDGLVRVFVAAQGSLVKSLQFAGDFNAVPDGLRRLEHTLRWRHLNADTMHHLVAEVRSASGTDAGWRRDSDVVAAVLSAGADAMDRCAAPVRPTGSCYFPEQGSHL
ncbi:lipoate--protein ligase family protein [Gordonia rhizosphera NBRC 16068]|uniref:lipoate--protein ligase family protein n=1 Tax=Gordonia rhizosphera TaxID=83341 RepID=UPI003EE30284